MKVKIFNTITIAWLIPLLVVLVFTSSCSSEKHHKRQEQIREWMSDNGKIKVLSTTGMINDLVNQIGGEHIDTLTLIHSDLDPHSYQLVKGDDEKLSFAQQIFFSGLGLEHGPSLHRYLTQNPKAISLGDSIEREYPKLVISKNRQRDPHIWMDVSIWAKAIPFIVDALSRHDPTHAAEFQVNGKKLNDEMEKIHAEVKKIMHVVPNQKRYLVTSHDAFSYFARAYLAEEEEIKSDEWEKRFAAPEGLAPESQLSTTHIAKIIDYLKQYQVQLLFPESNVSLDSIRKIVQAGKEQGLDIKMACCPLYSDALGQLGTESDTYLKMILYNARTLATHMNPTYME